MKQGEINVWIFSLFWRLFGRSWIHLRPTPHCTCAIESSWDLAKAISRFKDFKLYMKPRYVMWHMYDKTQIREYNFLKLRIQYVRDMLIKSYKKFICKCKIKCNNVGVKMQLRRRSWVLLKQCTYANFVLSNIANTIVEWQNKFIQ